MSETENFKKYKYYTLNIKERRDGLTQERVNRETKSLWYITEWEVDVMNVNDSIVWVFILKDFLEELYLYISRTIKQKGEWEYRVYTQSPGQV